MPVWAVYVFQPSSIADSAASRTGAGTGVSQTPCDKLMPPTRSHSRDMLRISERTTNAERSLSRNGIGPLLLTGGLRRKKVANRAARDFDILPGCFRIQRKRYHFTTNRLRFR